MDVQRKLLEELMNPLIGQAKSYRDPDVCAFQMVAFCPHDLFTNTKFDLGPCRSKIHDEKLREQYQASGDKGHLGWEQSFASLLNRLVQDMDRSIQKGKERLALTGPSGADDAVATVVAEGEAEQEEKIIYFEEQIKALTAQIEVLGEQGEVDRAQELLNQVESLKQNISSIRMTSGRRLTICEICSACLVANETAQRMDAHLSGKQHTGYLKIRQWLEAWKQSPLYSTPRQQEHGRRDHQGYARRDRESFPPPRERDRDRERNDDFRDRRTGGYRQNPYHRNSGRDGKTGQGGLSGAGARD